MTVELIYSSVEVVVQVKYALLLLLLHPEQLRSMSSIQQQRQVDETMKKFQSHRNYREMKEFVAWVICDDFLKETYKRHTTAQYTKELEQLKKEIIDFYLSNIQKVGDDIERVCDVYTRIGQYALQLMRFRLVIDPQIQLSSNVHSKTGIKYITVKGYWISDEGVKVRTITKSVGRAEDYTKGIKDPNAINDGITKVQQVIYQLYKEKYK